MSNGGTAYLQRKQAAEAFASSIQAATANPAIVRIDVMEKASKIVVVTQDGAPFMIENNDHSADDLAAMINKIMEFVPAVLVDVTTPVLDTTTAAAVDQPPPPDLSALTGATVLSVAIKDGDLIIEYQAQNGTTDQLSVKVSNV